MRYIYDALNDEAFKKRHIFHMPGHMGGRGLPDFLLRPELDVTELDETDDLHDASGVIKKSQEMAAEAFGAKHAYYMVNGSTGGVMAMTLGFLKDGDKVIADRFCHKSFISALALTGAEAVWVSPERIEGGILWGGLSPTDIKRAIDENRDAKAVFITAPNYFGMMGDIGETARLAHEAGMYLLVDGAHGAHFGMHPKLPPSIISLGADAVCLSLHKTLPALTQSAILLTNKRYEGVEAALKTVQSSSPSYLLMMSCENAALFFKNAEKAAFDELFENVSRYFPSQIEVRRKYVKYKDFTRVNARIPGNPFEAYDILRKEYNVAAECAFGGGIVAILTAFHKKSEIEYLKKCVDAVSANGENIPLTPLDAKKRASLREAFFAKKKRVSLREAAGKISAEGIMIYPPGIYQVLPGEEINKTHIEYFEALARKGAKIPQLDSEDNEHYCLIFDE